LLEKFVTRNSIRHHLHRRNGRPFRGMNAPSARLMTSKHQTSKHQNIKHQMLCFAVGTDSRLGRYEP
jgi:hypothetical protein